MRQVEFVGLRAILRHQQPARQTRLHDMKSRTCRVARELAQQHTQVAIQVALQFIAVCQRVAESRCRHAQGQTWTLHHGIPWTGRDTERNGNADDAFVADQTGLRDRALAGSTEVIGETRLSSGK